MAEDKKKKTTAPKAKVEKNTEAHNHDHAGHTHAQPDSDLIAPNVVFDLTIPVAELETARTKALAKAQKVMKADGFRIGHVPLKIVEQRLGEAGIMEMMVEEVLSPAYSAAVAEKNLSPLSDPEIKPKSMKMGEDWVLEIAVATMPEIDTSKVEKLVKDLHKKNELWTGENKDTPEAKLRQDRLQAILTHLLEEMKVPVPELLLRKETERQLHELGHQLEQLNLTLEEYAQKIEHTLEQIQQDYAVRALGSLQVEILLANLIRQMGIQLDSKEVEDVVRARVASQPEGKKTITRQELEYVQATLLKQKAVDHLLTISA